MNAGPTGSLFGSVTATNIADRLWEEQKIRVDRRKLGIGRRSSASAATRSRSRSSPTCTAELRVARRPRGRRAAARGGARGSRGAPRPRPPRPLRGRARRGQSCGGERGPKPSAVEAPRGSPPEAGLGGRGAAASPSRTDGRRARRGGRGRDRAGHDPTPSSRTEPPQHSSRNAPLALSRRGSGALSTGCGERARSFSTPLSEGCGFRRNFPLRAAFSSTAPSARICEHMFYHACKARSSRPRPHAAFHTVAAPAATAVH